MYKRLTLSRALLGRGVGVLSASGIASQGALTSERGSHGRCHRAGFFTSKSCSPHRKHRDPQRSYYLPELAVASG